MFTLMFAASDFIFTTATVCLILFGHLNIRPFKNT